MKQIIAKNIFPILTKKFSSDIIKLIIHYIFILSFISMILGFLGYFIPFIWNNKENSNTIKKEVRGVIKDTNRDKFDNNLYNTKNNDEKDNNEQTIYIKQSTHGNQSPIINVDGDTEIKF